MKHFPSLRIFLTLMALAALLALALPALAGGWAVVTLDRLPAQVTAGEPVTVGFLVLQHGIRPMGDLSPRIGLQKVGESTFEWVEARPAGESGHYTATLTFPSDGTWNWGIETDFWPEYQPMPALTVTGGSASALKASPAPASPMLVGIGAAGLLGVAVGLLALVRTKAPWAAGVTLVAALIGAIGFASAARQATAYETSAKADETSGVVAPEAQAGLGQRLFIAKGCVTCHAHEAVNDVRKQMGLSPHESFGPDLTKFSARPEYLQQWLDDPESIKPNTQMPKPHLNDDEIPALIAFINAP